MVRNHAARLWNDILYDILVISPFKCSQDTNTCINWHLMFLHSWFPDYTSRLNLIFDRESTAHSMSVHYAPVSGQHNCDDLLTSGTARKTLKKSWSKDWKILYLFIKFVLSWFWRFIYQLFSKCYFATF